MGNPKVLILTGALPYPLTTGAKLRTFNLLKTLADQFDIHLLTVLTDDDEKQHLQPIRDAGITCHYMMQPHLSGAFCKVKDAVLSYALSWPYLTRHYTSPEYKRRLLELMDTQGFDVIHCDSISLTENVRGIDSTRLILNQHNIEHMIWDGYRRHATNLPKRKFYDDQYRKVRALEESLANVYGYVVTVSENDRQTLAGYFPEDRIVVVDNGVDPEKYANDVPFESRHGVIFTGSLDWYPNIDGLTWFIDEVYTQFTTEPPAISIVGRRPSASLKEQLTGSPHVKVYADVREIQPFLHNSRVMMVPLRIGGGSRLKILEAMAADIPVVATSKGAEGLAVTSGVDILIADDPHHFALSIQEVLSDDRVARKLAANGRHLIEHRYAWETVARPLAALWRDIAHV